MNGGAPPTPRADRREVLPLLYGFLRNLHLHEVDNNLVQQLSVRLTRSLNGHVGRGSHPLSIRLFGGDLFLDGRLAGEDAGEAHRAHDMGALMLQAGIGGVWVDGEVERSALMDLGAHFAARLSRNRNVALRADFGSLHLGPLEEEPDARGDTTPSKLLVWLFAALVDLNEGLIEAATEGGRPSLLPYKRVLQRLVAAAEGRKELMQLVISIRDTSQPLSPGRRAAAEAVTAVGFGMGLGRSRSDLMTLGLGAALARISESCPGSGTIGPLLGFRGMGDLSPIVLLAAQDARSIPSGPIRGSFGQILALVRAWEDGLESGVGKAPGHLLESLWRLPPPGVPQSLVEAFVRWWGLPPTGSLVQLQDQSHALVLRSPTAAAPALVTRIDEQEAGPAFETEEGTPQAIAAWLSPKERGLDLSQIRRKTGPMEDGAGTTKPSPARGAEAKGDPPEEDAQNAPVEESGAEEDASNDYAATRETLPPLPPSNLEE